MTAYYNEFDAGAAAWLRELIKQGLIADGEVDERSILDVRPDELRGFTQCHFFAGIGGWSYALRLTGWSDSRPVWTGSPPCQPFSNSGARKGRDDARHLAPHFISLVRDCRPPVLFGEQVASAGALGHIAGKAKSRAAQTPKWAWIDDLSDRLEAAQYAVGASDITAASVAAPHKRNRTFFGAIRMADTAGRSGSNEREQCGGEHRLQPESRGAMRQGYKGPQMQPNAARGLHTARQNIGWSTPHILYTRDGATRPIEPRSFPLANGLSARLGRVRGYGNAINPILAAEYIDAFSIAAEI